MAGIWERVRGNSDVRLNVSLLETELTGVALGVRTRAEARTSLEAEMGQPLVGDEITDLTALADQFEAGNIQAKLVYIHKVKFALNAAELELIDEATFRSVLAI